MLIDINLDTLIPIEKMYEQTDEVFALVEKHGKVVLIKNNAPAYVIIKPQSLSNQKSEMDTIKPSQYTLHDAMRIVLSDAENHQMHSADLADTIFARGLYRQKNGDKAKYNQIRARCGHYPQYFEALPENIIKLRT